MMSHEKARRSGWVQTAGLDTNKVGWLLDHAEHNRADEGECSIGGKHAHSVDDSHGNAPWLTSLPCNHQASKSFPDKKVSLAVYCRFPTAGTLVKTS